MRVAVVCHALDQPSRGNFATVQRWRRHVRGAELLLVPPDPGRRFDPVPDLFHGYHALHGGVAALALARRHGRPLVISLGGTDLLALVEESPGHEEIRRVLREADVVTGAFDGFGALLRGVVRAYVTVPRGVEAGALPSPKPPDGSLSVLLPAGLREVKDPLLAVEMARTLHRRGLPVALRIAGPVLSESYAARVHAAAAGLDFISIGEVEHEGMGEVYRASDVVWNTSRAEGGANALLEALAAGCAVFARNVMGNRELLPPECLFDAGDEGRLVDFHRSLLAESGEARRARAGAALRLLRERHDPAGEARALEQAWARATPRSSAPPGGGAPAR